MTKTCLRYIICNLQPLDTTQRFFGHYIHTRIYSFRETLYNINPPIMWISTFYAVEMVLILILLDSEWIEGDDNAFFLRWKTLVQKNDQKHYRDVDCPPGYITYFWNVQILYSSAQTGFCIIVLLKWLIIEYYKYKTL